jgi:glutamate racemase
MQSLPRSVAFFDSGIGGLTVLSACKKRINAPFYYYGDNAYAPYGNRSVLEIRERVFSAFSLFEKMQVQAAVVACNTATAVCIDELRRRFSFPVIGTEPAVRTAVKYGGEIFILTTRATYESVRFQALCKRLSCEYPNANLRPFACEGLAGDIERNLLTDGYDCTPLLPKGKPCAVVLGCTHYVYMQSQIQAFYNCPVFDGNDGVARRLQYELNRLTATDRDGQPLLTPDVLSPKTAPVFFLGSSKAYNEHVYEQMFVKK